jgi:hypothetical protein
VRIAAAILCIATLIAAAFLFLRAQPTTSATATVVVHTVPTPPAPATPPTPDFVLDLFEPTPSTLDAQQAETAITGRIEHTLTVLFLLTSCHLITQQHYADSYNNLVRYALEAKLAPTAEAAEQRLRQIGSSAGASYSLIYSRVPCDDPSLPPLVAQLNAWQATSPAARAVEAPSPR